MMDVASRNISALCVAYMLSLTCHAQGIRLDSIRNIGLPVINIETLNHEEPACDYVSHPDGCFGESISNATKVPGRLAVMSRDSVIYDSRQYQKDAGGITINIRGNTSAYLDKKSFRIKLQRKHDLLFRNPAGRYDDTNWLLLPESINTMIGLNVNRLLGMPYAPSYTFVNLVINGDYRGTYMLVESVHRNPGCRINVSESGYIIERDAYWWNEEVSFSTGNVDTPYRYTFQYPDADKLTSSRISYIQDYVNRLEQSIPDGTYQDYIDVSSFAAWLLAHDVLGDMDSAGSNIFLTKYDDTDRTRMEMGPLWDFGAIATTDGRWSAIHEEDYYFKSLLESPDPEFLNAYRNLWEEVSPTLFDSLYDTLYAFSDSDMGRALEASKLLDQIRWDYRDVTFREDIDAAVDWLSNRRTWLEKAIPGITVDIAHRHIAADDGKVYDLTGRAVGSDTGRACTSSPQIYIRNGKKYFHLK